MVKLVTLMDNLPSEHKALINEHGLSVLIEKDNHFFLFDCGASPTFMQNAYRLGIDLRKLESVILSHAHYDHAAGYRYLQDSFEAPKTLFTGNHFFEKKYERFGIKYTNLSAGFDRDFLIEKKVQHRIVRDCTEISEGIWAIGNFNHKNNFEKIPPSFVKEVYENVENALISKIVEDNFEDEICLAIETKKGIVVQVGCSHPGILNIVETVHERLNKPVYAVFGGTHLVHADEERIKETVRRLKLLGVEIIGFSHCSGAAAENFLHSDTEVKSCHLAVGDMIMF